MSITEYNGSALVAMVGKNCFAIASDRRLGVQLQTVATDFKRISQVHDRLFIGLSGIRGSCFGTSCTSFPVIAGLGDEDKPFICTMDSIGAKELAKDFVVAGTASESLYGACEAMFKPDMVTERSPISCTLLSLCEPEELFETVSQALLSSVDRDCLSGWGGHVFVV
ncbi:proteasome subunit beta type-3-A [Pyrus ussuriensis x Pyrus communis]|uniref:Proteasome subunit beta type-3-A n=1 Tax=Pyrus ussuriensis x Pyrus communis TaxID=2448454 RepID=A0A5N5GFE8_9ROSA|nr:proteasome subunit beta type-3-A [Pyrus ussuriensis x Pyrus communis]